MKGLPQIPSLDRSDPAVMRRAAGVAKRRNTLARRKLPLFAELLPVVTAEQVMNERAILQAGWKERRREMMRLFKETDRKVRADCRALCANDEEFLHLMRGQFKTQYGLRCRSNRWGVLRLKLERRLTPLTADAELVLAWMEQIEEPITPGELWQSRGDGLSQRAILDALLELEGRVFVRMHEGRKCPVTGVPHAATFLRIDPKSAPTRRATQPQKPRNSTLRESKPRDQEIPRVYQDSYQYRV